MPRGRRRPGTRSMLGRFESTYKITFGFGSKPDTALSTAPLAYLGIFLLSCSAMSFLHGLLGR